MNIDTNNLRIFANTDNYRFKEKEQIHHYQMVHIIAKKHVVRNYHVVSGIQQLQYDILLVLHWKDFH